MDIDFVPRLQIGTWPTPTRRLDRTSEVLGAEVWTKLEEDCGAWGGNKVRKLEFLFHELRARAIERVVVWGAASSNWAAACAWHGSRNGFEMFAGLGGHLPESYRRIYDAAGVPVIVLPRIELAPVAAVAARVRSGRRARVLPVGGSGGLGDLGPVTTGVEIARSIAWGELPAPTGGVFVAAGSCGTVAGIAAGLGIEHVSVPVVAVKVADWPYATPSMIGRRTRNIARLLAAHEIEGATNVPIELDTGAIGRGYGRVTTAAREAIALARRDDVDLDQVYGAKAFGALIARARSGEGPFLFIHTSPGPPPVR